MSEIPTHMAAVQLLGHGGFHKLRYSETVPVPEPLQGEVLIRVSAARNAFVGVEHLTDAEIEEIRARCETRAKAELARRVARRRPHANGATGPL